VAVVALTGLCVLDQIFAVDRLPAGAGKHFATAYRETLGGIAANAAMAIARLGGTARLFSRVGDDEAGRRVCRWLERAGVEVGTIELADGCQTPRSTVCVDRDGERQIVNHKDPALFAAAPTFDVGGADAAMADLRWPAGTGALLDASRSRGVPRLLDVDQAPETADIALEAASHLVFGEAALRALSGDADPARGLTAVHRQMPASAVAVTCGGDGIWWRGAVGDDGHIAAHAVPVVDTLGAGDVFHGAAALALAEGMNFADALAFANAAAAVKVTRPSGPEHLPSRAETERLWRENRWA